MEGIYIEPRDRRVPDAMLEEGLDRLLRRYPNVKRVLIIPPDFTRCYSEAGKITRVLYKKLHGECSVDIMPAVGTHAEVNAEEREAMFGPEIPAGAFLHHRWQTDTVSLGQVPGDFVKEVSDGDFTSDIAAEVDHRLVDGGYDLILSVGQVVPHEVVGMSNYSKNIFVGVGGREMINKSHMIGALYGVEKTLGSVDTPVRRVFDYAQEHYLKNVPLVYILTVTTKRGEDVTLNALYLDGGREAFERACKLSQECNITYVDRPLKKVVAYLDPLELKSTWVGNKGIYRTRMAIADGGELLLLAPGVCSFGENEEIDSVIRKYGYGKGRESVLGLYNSGAFGDRIMAAAHLIQSSPEGRFRVAYATDPARLSAKEVEGVGFSHMDFGEAVKRYNPDRMKEGFNTLPDGEEIYFVHTPAAGLWKRRDPTPCEDAGEAGRVFQFWS